MENILVTFPNKFRICLFLVMALCSLAANAQSSSPGVTPTPYFSEPAISPDNSEIAFVSGGDIWTVPASGGEARLLISHPATESRPVYSPDGRRLAFVSTRTGNGDIYLLTFDTGDLKRLTFDDGYDQLDGWSRDGRWIYFTSTSRDIAGMGDILRVSVDGGTPMQVTADRYVNEFFSAPSPDGTSVAFSAHGIASAQWWRKGHSHLDESEIWLMHDGPAPSYERISDGSAKELWPMWSADGKSVFYVSDRNGAQNIWVRPLGGAARQVTSFEAGRVLWPNISYDGRSIVFERDFKIWKLDTGTGQSSEVRIARKGVPAGPSVDHIRQTDRFQELALSPDGKKVAVVARGEVFAASATDGGDAVRVTFTTAAESQVTWSPDSRKLAYCSDRDGSSHLFLYDFAVNAETRLTNGPGEDDTPRFSHDGKLLAFERNGKELRVIDLSSKRERMLATGLLERPPFKSDRPFVWSPDSRWIAYMSIAEKYFKNVNIVGVENGQSKPVSFLANVFSNSVSWSADGTFILFDTGQRTETTEIARVDLIPRTPKFREDQFRDLFKEETPKPTAPAVETKPENRTQAQPPPHETPTPTPAAAEAKKTGSLDKIKPVLITFEDLRKRLSLLPVGVDVGYQTISPDGKWLLMIAGAAGQQNLYVYPLDELAKEAPVARQLTSTSGGKSFAQFSPDSKEVFYLEQGRINIVPLEFKPPRSVSVTAEMDVDFAQEKMEVFRQAWTYLRDDFFDPHFNGVDWTAERATYERLIAGARTNDELRRLVSLMIGELNASHSGIYAPFGATQPSTGRIGLRFDRLEYEKAGRLRITEVIPLSPAALAGNVKEGDYLLSVDGLQIGAHTNLDDLLNYKIGRRVVLTVAAAEDGGGKREVAVRPVNQTTEKGLMYRKWVEDNRAYVARISGGRLGYVHMYDMSSNSLAQLYVDLDAENQSRDGVVIDVRNNNGGFVNVYAIDVLARRSYLTMTVRGFPSAPSRAILGQRALETPTILVTNRHSLSDAEDFTEGYRSLGLGKVVGEPTAGWIIYTSNEQLIDGSLLRIPFMKVSTRNGSAMEMHPRPVDIPVDRPVGESYLHRDSDLDAAVAELLKQLGNGQPQAAGNR
jgi:tricorn protease